MRRSASSAAALGGKAHGQAAALVGLHMRLIGHPARAVGLERLLDHISQHDGVWVARHWMATHPYPGKGLNE